MVYENKNLFEEFKDSGKNNDSTSTSKTSEFKKI